MAKGEVFSLNIDDTSCKYDEIFDPDLREFYDAESLPSQLLNLDELNKFEVNDKIIMNSDFRTMRAGNEYNVREAERGKLLYEITTNLLIGECGEVHKLLTQYIIKGCW